MSWARHPHAQPAGRGYRATDHRGDRRHLPGPHPGRLGGLSGQHRVPRGSEEAKAAVTAAEQELARCVAQQQKRDSQRARNALREAEANATVARENLVRVEAQKIDATTARRTLRNFDTIWAELSADERRQLLRSLIHRVHIDGEKGTMRIDFASAGIAALASQEEDDE